MACDSCTVVMVVTSGLAVTSEGVVVDAVVVAAPAADVAAPAADVSVPVAVVVVGCSLSDDDVGEDGGDGGAMGCALWRIWHCAFLHLERRGLR